MLHQKIIVPYILLCTARFSLFHTETLFSPLKYIVYKCYSCFRQRRGHLFVIVTLVYSGNIAFPYIMHSIHVSHFFMLHQKIFVPYSLLCTARLSLFHTETLFSPLKYIVYKCYRCFRQRRGRFFHCHTFIQWLHSFSLYNVLYTLLTLFGASSKKYFPIYSLVHSTSQSVSHLNSVFSFRIHCLQMLQLFQIKKGQYFSSSHLYTVVT